MSKKIVDTYEEDEPYRIEEEPIEQEDYMDMPDETIHPGLYLKSRYVLLALIGKGGNAGVWLAYCSTTRKYYAVKVQRGECFDDGKREVRIIRAVNQYAKSHPKENTHCVQMLDSFIFDTRDDNDEKESYVCSVYDLYAGSLNILLTAGKYKYGFPIPIVKEITRQILKGLSVLHEKLKIVHTDIKPHNILIAGINPEISSYIEAFDTKTFHETLGRLVLETDVDEIEDQIDMFCVEAVKPVTAAVEKWRKLYPRPDIDGEEEEEEEDEDSDEEEIFDVSDDEYELNDEVVVANHDRRQSVDDTEESLLDDNLYDLDHADIYDITTVLCKRVGSSDGTRQVISDEYFSPEKLSVVITDFGNSYFVKSRTNNEVCDRRYRPPEVIIDVGYSRKCDIWSLGCLVFELLTGYVLFEPSDVPVNQDLQHLYLIEKHLAEIPLRMKKASRRRQYLFDADRNYQIRSVKPFSKLPLTNRLMKQFLFSKREANEIMGFLKHTLEIDQNVRYSADQLLKHSWLATSA
jgi:serine/threonine-protein kinase SRPK3